MSVLLSTPRSRIAHLSYDGKTTVCGTILGDDMVHGDSMGYIGTDRRCQHCPKDGFIAYFDKLRRHQAITAAEQLTNMGGRPRKSAAA